MDMRPQYRDELSRLRKSEKKLKRDMNNHDGKCWQEIKRIERSAILARKRVGKELDRIQRRRAILEGRL